MIQCYAYKSRLNEAAVIFRQFNVEEQQGIGQSVHHKEASKARQHGRHQHHLPHRHVVEQDLTACLPDRRAHYMFKSAM